MNDRTGLQRLVTSSRKSQGKAKGKSQLVVVVVVVVEMKVVRIDSGWDGMGCECVSCKWVDRSSSKDGETSGEKVVVVGRGFCSRLQVSSPFLSVGRVKRQVRA